MVTRPLRLFPIKTVFETASYVTSHLYRNIRNWKQKCFHQLFHFNFDSMTIRFVLADEPKLFFLDDCYFFSFFHSALSNYFPSPSKLRSNISPAVSTSLVFANFSVNISLEDVFSFSFCVCSTFFSCCFFLLLLEFSF